MVVFRNLFRRKKQLKQRDMKILEQNEHKYSREQFEGYTHRYMFRLTVDDDFRNDSLATVYSDNKNREEVSELINTNVKENVISCKMEHWTTKEQDDRDILFIEETLKDI